MQVDSLSDSTYSNCPMLYRFLHQLKEENSELINQLWTDIQQKIATQSQRAPPGTPSSVLSAQEQKG